MHLEISRPKGFRFNAGDYIFVNIPKIARYEWHPFTISSSAEGKYPLSLHVRYFTPFSFAGLSFFQISECLDILELSIHFSYCSTSINNVCRTFDSYLPSSYGIGEQFYSNMVQLRQMLSPRTITHQQKRLRHSILLAW